MAAPIAPATAPRKKPNRRPLCCISGDSHGAVVIEPNTIIEMGSVAKHGLLDNMLPAKPATTNNIGICAPRIAWAATSTVTLRRVRVSSNWVIAGNSGVSVAEGTRGCWCQAT